MKKLIILLALCVAVFSLVGCGSTPAYKVVGKVDLDDLYIFYVTVSGEYDEGGLKRVCKELPLKDDITNVIYFFAPNAPRNDKDTGFFDAGMPDSDYSIAAYSMEDGEFKE